MSGTCRASRGSDRPLRVLFLNENIGGHSTVHLNLERVMTAVPSIEPSFVHVPRPGLARRIAGAPIPFLDRVDGDLQPLRSQLSTSAAARRILARVASGYDALHVYTQNAGLLSTKLLATMPAVVSLDTTNSLNAYRLPYRTPGRFTPWTVKVTRPFERRVFEAATLVVANTEWAAESVRTYGVPSPRVRVLPFGVEVPDAEPDRRPTSPPTITFVGRQMERKGGYRLLDLHQRVLARRCRLLLVTTDPVDPRPGTSVIDDIVPGDGRIADVLADTSVFVFPSPIDQAPNAVLEAMASGVPVVALRTGGVPEMVADGVTGILVDEGDERGLARAIENLLDDPARAESMGRAGRRRALDHFDIRKTAYGLAGVISEARDLYEREGTVR